MLCLYRCAPAVAALVAGTLVTVNGFRADRPPADPLLGKYDPPVADAVTARRRTDFKFEVVADLIAGQLSAAEARTRFLDINRSDPRSLAFLRELPGESDEERTAWQLVLFVAAFRHPRAKEVAAAVSRELLGRDVLLNQRTDGIG